MCAAHLFHCDIRWSVHSPVLDSQLVTTHRLKLLIDIAANITITIARSPSSSVGLNFQLDAQLRKEVPGDTLSSMCIPVAPVCIMAALP